MSSDKKITVAIADDHLIFRNGLKSLLSAEPDIEITGEAADAKQLMELLSVQVPVVTIVDISMPGLSGIEATRDIVSAFPCTSVLILSMHTAPEYIINAIQAGARGYLPKDISKTELTEAIRALSRGGDYFSRSVSETVMQGLMRQRKDDAELASLTSREKEILILSASGMTNKEMATKLFISPRTVDCHKNHIMQKLSLKSSAELILYAVRNGFVKL
ncbi:MAG TPA: DNA-binding response regulator [Bacteroidales bacterium]|nr:MAG: hypothetical protein A2X11_05450 [Bacteroidetes bacterium GWE2_42_24]OFY26539.1 MAG: hypothetical protein A2X09_03115 [Bacteroidetes bacterium GWF2_43_11]HBZ67416.1 DNA-binding response regulator [Bacteroidales bacterium]